MNALSKIPFWGWYLFSVAFSYWLWNPAFSFGQFMMTDIAAPVKALLCVLTLILTSLYIVEGHRSLNVFAIVLFFSLFGCIGWLAISNGFHSTGTIQWWGQWVVGLLLALAIQGSRLYRSLTGRVSVINGDQVEGHHH